MELRASPNRTKGTVDQESTGPLFLGLYLGHENCLCYVGNSYKKNPQTRSKSLLVQNYIYYPPSHLQNYLNKQLLEFKVTKNSTNWSLSASCYKLDTLTPISSLGAQKFFFP